MKACDGGYEEVVSQLIEAGVNVNAECDYGWTALTRACDGGYDGIVSKLIEAGMKNVDAKDTSGDTALMYACMRGHGTIVSTLLEARVDVDARNDRGQTAFDIAKAWCRNSEIASMVENAIIIADKTAGSAFSP